MKRYMHDVQIGLDSLMSNKLKSILTALGIIFGVAAVISMLAIGNGAQQEILKQIEMVGVNNIVITPILELKAESDDNSTESNNKSKKFSPGLTIKDVEAIKQIIPSVKRISPEIEYSSFVLKNGKRESSKLIGVTEDYFSIFNLKLQEGTTFKKRHEIVGLPVCVVGANIKVKFFNNESPIGKQIKFGHVWLTIIGVLEKSANVDVSAFENLGVSVANDKIYVPVKTMLMRFENRALIKTGEGGMTFFGGGFMISSGANKTESKKTNQLDKIVVQIDETDQLKSSTEILGNMFLRRHNGVKDFEITVPELLLKQQQETKKIFNIVLGAIAGISLIVGGIGIMNIMFASVMERIKEIGTRLAIGATKKDIVAQFLSEAILISVTGGLIGVILGVGLAQFISYFFEITTIVSVLSVFVAFGVSAAVGVVFGYSPAKRAAEKDPIESLRYE
ncbi:MAG: ABC transporter permease [Bacteroidales bacterium]|nr:ABC transporter permease [Bacteroidales bacterium]